MNAETALPASGEEGDVVDRTARFFQESMRGVLEGPHVSAVYGEPVQSGDTLIIPAAEVLGTMGFGGGAGSNPSQTEGENQPSKGIGGGGGGYHFSRPVAVIVASPDGVRVEPVVDVTKISLAALTAFGFMLSTLLRMRRR